MSEGILKAGFDIVYSNDVNEQVITTYTTRHERLGYRQGENTYFECEDIRKLKGVDIIEKIKGLEKYKKIGDIQIDAIFGGPPCQGFSRAGKRDSNDPRNMLFKEYIRIVSEIQPNYLVMENVEGMLTMKLYDFESLDGSVYKGGVNVINLLKSEFERIHYQYLEPRILTASDYGVPQKRKRLILLGYKEGVVQPEYPEKEEHLVTVKEAFEGLYDNHVKSLYAQERSKNLINKKDIKNTETSKHDVVIQERFSLFKEGESQRQTRNRIEQEGIDLSKKPHLVNLLKEKVFSGWTEKEIIAEMKKPNRKTEEANVLLTKKNSRTRLSNNDVSPTILTTSDDYIHPTENRSLTVREMARLQSFDDDFEFFGKRTTGGHLRKKETPQMTQVGNAVPPILAEKIARKIIEAIQAN